MGRRGITVVLGFITAVLLVAGIRFSPPIPYVVLSPGPTADVVGEYNGTTVIQVEGAPTSESDGELRMLTVYERSTDIDLLTALRAWWSDEEAIIPRELIYPDDVSQEQVQQQNEEDFSRSQSSAQTAALRELGYPVQVTVSEVVAGAAADGSLEVGDVITAVDGVQVTSARRLVELVREKPAGTERTIDVVRDGEDRSVAVTTAPAAADDPTPRIGVSVDEAQPHPFEITIDLEDVGGPSAGMMFALGIIDRLTPEDLTGGKIIAGTGTIDSDGDVGPIGGVPQKMYGARDAGAHYFLTPADNCAEAKENALDGLRLIRVATLDDALAALETIRAGGDDLPVC